MSVTKAEINDKNELVLTFSDGSSVNLGNVKGDEGETGATGATGADGVGIESVTLSPAGDLSVKLTSGTTLELGNIKGQKGEDGKNGLSITQAKVSSGGELILTFSDGHTLNCGDVKGDAGVGISGVAFNAKGELVITMTDGSSVNLGKLPVCNHSFGSWSVGKAPTCTSIGYDSRTCTSCGVVDYRFHSEKGHTWDEGYLLIAPTCQKDGLSISTCTLCGDTKSNVLLAAETDHEYGKDDVCIHCGAIRPNEGLEYILSEDGTYAILIGPGSCTDSHIVVASTYLGRPVEEVRGHAFYCNNGIVSITFQEGLRVIGPDAFGYCPTIQAVYLPASLEKIQWSAFRSCSKLTTVSFAEGCQLHTVESDVFLACSSLVSIQLPDTVCTMESGVFYQCLKLKEFRLPASMTYVPPRTFYQCQSMTTLTLSGPVHSFGESAFVDNQSLTTLYATDLLSLCNAVYDSNPLAKVVNLYIDGQKLSGDLVFPEGTQKIPSYICQKNTAITSVVLPAGVETIGLYSFQYCSALKSVTLPEGLRSVGAYAFRGCGLSSVSLPSTLRGCGSNAFGSLSKVYSPDIESWCLIAFEDSNPLATTGNLYIGGQLLEHADIPEGITVLHEGVFANCSSLKKVSIPSSLQTVLPSAFYGCTELEEVHIVDLAAWFGIYFGQPNGSTDITFGTGVNPLEYASRWYLNGELLTDITVPDGITTIQGAALLQAKMITSVTLPDSVTRIREYAFSGCSSLASVDLSDGLTAIDDRAFHGCSSLTSIRLPDSLTTIAENAFGYCGLVDITLPASLETIKTDAFKECTSLTAVYVDSLEEWLAITLEFDKGISRNPEYASPLYYAKNLYVDGVLLTHLTVDASTPQIKPYAFAGCSLSKLTVPEGVTLIGEKAFFACASLTEVSLPSSLTKIDTGAFAECTALAEIALPSQLQELGASAFYGCSALTEVLLPEGTKTLGNYVFAKCSSLRSAYLPDSITSMGTNTFLQCHSLVSVKLPANLSSLPANTFTACSSLQTVSLPEDMVLIGTGAFQSCYSLFSIRLPAKLKTIQNNAFEYCFGLAEVCNDSALNIIAGSTAFGRVGEHALRVYSTAEGTGSRISVEDGFALYRDGTDTYLLRYVGDSTSLTIPSEVTVIRSYALYQCGDIASVEFLISPWQAYDSPYTLTGTDFDVSDPAENAYQMTVYRVYYIWKLVKPVEE